MPKSLSLIDFYELSNNVQLPAVRLALRLTHYSEHCMREVIEDQERLFKLLGAAIKWPEVQARLLLEACEKSCSNAQSISDARSLSRALLGGSNALWLVYCEKVMDFWRQDPTIVKAALHETIVLLESALISVKCQLPNLQHVKDLYQLDSLETLILELAVLNRQIPAFELFLKHFPLLSKSQIWQKSAHMLGCEVAQLKTLLSPNGRLRHFGLIRVDGSPDHLGEFIQTGPVANRLFRVEHETAESLQMSTLCPLDAPKLMNADFPHLTREIELIAQCIRNGALASAQGLNILIHGPSGAGKHELARLLVQTADLPGFKIGPVDLEAAPGIEQDNRLECLDWSQGILQTHPGAALVFDGLDDAAKYCKDNLIQQLRSGLKPVIWIGQGTGPLPYSVLRHFAFHLNLTSAPISVRRTAAARALGNTVVDIGTVEAIAANTDISPAQLQMAARFAQMSCKEKTDQGPALLMALEAGQRAKGQMSSPWIHAPQSAHWDLDGLNLETAIPLQKIVEALRRSKCGSLAFHGIPGTGKTSLAAYIAEALDKPLLTKRVSDLSSKFIGETEKAIAAMFREASEESAVLLLDEGDSFLRDRRLARSSWEITQVNEMLQQMESYNGVFICATNLMEDIDAAALRRFTFKIKFLALDMTRRLRMLARYALQDPDADLPGAITVRLGALSQLAPGDFATVKRQETIVNERFSLEAWISSLEREHSTRAPWVKTRAAFV